MGTKPRIQAVPSPCRSGADPRVTVQSKRSIAGCRSGEDNRGWWQRGRQHRESRILCLWPHGRGYPRTQTNTGCFLLNQAAVLALKAKNEGVTGIIGQCLSFPVTCHPKFFDSVGDKYELGSYIQNHEASVVNTAKMEFFWDVYEPDAKPDPYHSPLLAKDLSGLPPARKLDDYPPPPMGRGLYVLYGGHAKLTV